MKRIFRRLKKALTGKDKDDLEKHLDDPEYLLAAGHSFFEDGKLPEAIYCLIKAEKIDPTNTDILNQIVAVYSQTEGDDNLMFKAVEYADKVLHLDPDNFQALNNKGTALEALGKFKEAIRCYDQALKINPKYVKALNNKGRALKVLGEYEESIKYFNKVLKIEPGYKKALYNKHKALENMGELAKSTIVMQKYVQSVTGDESICSDKEFLKKHNQEAAPYKKTIMLHNRAMDLIELRKYSDALKKLDLAIKEYNKLKVDKNEIRAKGTYLNLMNDKGMALIKLKNIKEAIHCFDVALEIDPTDETVLRTKESALNLLEEK